MKTIDLEQTNEELVRLLDQAGGDDLVVRMADGREFLLIALDEFDKEIARSRNNPRLMALLEARASQSETILLEEIKRQLQI